MSRKIDLNQPNQGTQDWHTPLNTNFSDIENAVNEGIDFYSMFAAVPTDPVSMAVDVLPGVIFDMKDVTNVAKQTTSNLAAPSSNDRIDRVVADKADGTISVETGTEASSPSAPDVPDGKVPLAQISLSPATTEITESDITDERSWLPDGEPTKVIVDGTQKHQWTIDVDTSEQKMTITTS